MPGPAAPALPDRQDARRAPRARPPGNESRPVAPYIRDQRRQVGRVRRAGDGVGRDAPHRRVAVREQRPRGGQQRRVGPLDLAGPRLESGRDDPAVPIGEERRRSAPAPRPPCPPPRRRDRASRRSSASSPAACSKAAGSARASATSAARRSAKVALPADRPARGPGPPPRRRARPGSRPPATWTPGSGSSSSGSTASARAPGPYSSASDRRALIRTCGLASSGRAHQQLADGRRREPGRLDVRAGERPRGERRGRTASGSRSASSRRFPAGGRLEPAQRIDGPQPHGQERVLHERQQRGHRRIGAQSPGFARTPDCSSGGRSSCDRTRVPPSTPPKNSPLRGPPILARAVTASAAVGRVERRASRSAGRSAAARRRCRAAGPGAKAAATRTVESGSARSGTRSGVGAGSPIRPAPRAADPPHQRVGRHQRAAEQLGLEVARVLGGEHRRQLLDDRLLLGRERPRRRAGGRIPAPARAAGSEGSGIDTGRRPRAAGELERNGIGNRTEHPAHRVGQAGRTHARRRAPAGRSPR